MSTLHYRNYRIKPSDRKTFRDGRCRKVTLPAGTELFRVITPGNSKRYPQFRGNHVIGQFWFRQSVVSQIIRLMKQNNSSFEDTCRSILAVQQDWNPEMSDILRIRTERPIQAWIGNTKHQRLKKEDSKVLHTGNAEQVFIPHLTDAELKAQNEQNLSSLSHMTFYGSVRSFNEAYNH